jgi:hypothetical protein
MSDAVFPRSDLWRGKKGLAVGNVGGVCRDTAAGRGGVEMSVDRNTSLRKCEHIECLEYKVGVTVRDKRRLEMKAGNTDNGERGHEVGESNSFAGDANQITYRL